MDGNSLNEALDRTINVRQLMEILSQYDGRFPVCFKDNKNNMIVIKPEDIKMDNVNVLLSNHTHILDVTAVVIKGDK